MRWWNELRTPAMKCDRIGHKEREQYRSGFTRSDGYRHVADQVEQKRCYCARCKLILSEWEDVSRTGLHGLTMDSDRMRILQDEGEVWS